MNETFVAEVELLDADKNVVEHGTCTVVLGPDPGHFQAHSFRSSSRPNESWPLPPQHSFQLKISI